MRQSADVHRALFYIWIQVGTAGASRSPGVFFRDDMVIIKHTKYKACEKVPWIVTSEQCGPVGSSGTAKQDACGLTSNRIDNKKAPQECKTACKQPCTWAAHLGGQILLNIQSISAEDLELSPEQAVRRTAARLSARPYLPVLPQPLSTALFDGAGLHRKPNDD